MTEVKAKFTPQVRAGFDERRVFEQSPTYYNGLRRLYDLLTTTEINGQKSPYVRIGHPIVHKVAVWAPVHRHNFDSPLMASLAAREKLAKPLHFLGKDNMYFPLEMAAQKSLDSDSKLGRMGLKLATKLDYIPRSQMQLGGGFPVDRDNPDIEAVLNWGRQRLSGGQSVGIYPYGTRIEEEPERIHKTKPGAALVAIDSNAPLYPIVFWGDHVVRRFGMHANVPPMVVNVGQPIMPEEFVDYPVTSDVRAQRAAVKMTRVLRTSMQDLLDEAREYASQEDWV